MIRRPKDPVAAGLAALVIAVALLVAGGFSAVAYRDLHIKYVRTVVATVTPKPRVRTQVRYRTQTIYVTSAPRVLYRTKRVAVPGPVRTVYVSAPPVPPSPCPAPSSQPPPVPSSPGPSS